MQVELSEPLGQALNEAAARQSLSLPQFVERVLTEYLASQGDDSLPWVRATSGRLPRVWGEEDFSDWHPPHAS